MKIKEASKEIARISFSVMEQAEVYKDGGGVVYMRTKNGIVNLTTGEHITHDRVTSVAVFIHCPEATLVLS